MTQKWPKQTIFCRVATQNMLDRQTKFFRDRTTQELKCIGNYRLGRKSWQVTPKWTSKVDKTQKYLKNRQNCVTLQGCQHNTIRATNKIIPLSYSRRVVVASKKSKITKNYQVFPKLASEISQMSKLPISNLVNPNRNYSMRPLLLTQISCLFQWTD